MVKDEKLIKINEAIKEYFDNRLAEQGVTYALILKDFQENLANMNEDNPYATLAKQGVLYVEKEGDLQEFLPRMAQIYITKILVPHEFET